MLFGGGLRGKKHHLLLAFKASLALLLREAPVERVEYASWVIYAVEGNAILCPKCPKCNTFRCWLQFEACQEFQTFLQRFELSEIYEHQMKYAITLPIPSCPSTHIKKKRKHFITVYSLTNSTFIPSLSISLIVK